MKGKLLFVFCLILFCSCNSSKLEWWESVNTSKDRLENASGRNDDSKFESFMFKKMDQLEHAVKPYRMADWWEEGNTFTRIIAISYIVLLFGSIIICLIVRHIEPLSDWPRIVLGIMSVMLVFISIPYYLFSDDGTRGNSLDIGSILGLVAMILVVPYVLDQDDLNTNRFAPLEYFTPLFGALPLMMVVGAIFRVIATWGSYIFMLGMLAYMVVVVVTSIKAKEKVFKTLLSLVYIFITTIGTVAMLYHTMPAMVKILNDLLCVVLGYLFLKGGATSSSSSSFRGSDSNEDPSNDLFNIKNMHDTGETDSEGHTVFHNSVNNKHYISTISGFEEVEKR